MDRMGGCTGRSHGHPAGVWFLHLMLSSLAAPVSESQEGQGPGPVNRAQLQPPGLPAAVSRPTQEPALDRQGPAAALQWAMALCEPLPACPPQPCAPCRRSGGVCARAGVPRQHILSLLTASVWPLSQLPVPAQFFKEWEQSEALKAKAPCGWTGVVAGLARPSLLGPWLCGPMEPTARCALAGWAPALAGEFWQDHPGLAVSAGNRVSHIRQPPFSSACVPICLQPGTSRAQVMEKGMPMRVCESRNLSVMHRLSCSGA